MHFGLCDTAPLMFPLTILVECKGNIINMSDPSIASCCFNENQVSEKMPLHSLLTKQWQMSKWREVDDHGHAISVSPGAKRMMTTWRPALWADAISICQYQVRIRSTLLAMWWPSTTDNRYVFQVAYDMFDQLAGYIHEA